MTHEEKINYMGIACSVVGYKFEIKYIDMIVSLYDLVQARQGETDLYSIGKVQAEVEQREREKKIEAEKLKEK